MNTLKSLALILSFLISFNSFHHIAFADDHGEDEYIHEENENDYDNYDEIPDDLENEGDNQEEEKESDDELYN